MQIETMFCKVQQKIVGKYPTVCWQYFFIILDHFQYTKTAKDQKLELGKA